MARTKGSRNKKTSEVVVVTAESIREQINTLEEKLADLAEQTKATKAEIKDLKKQLVAAEEAEAAAQAEADKEAVLAAFLASGKSAAEVIELLK